MKLNSKALALSLGVLTAILSVLCAFLIRFWPEATMKFFGWVTHMDLLGFVGQRVVTWSNFLGGTIVMFLAAYISGWIFASLYNRISK